MSHFPSGPKSSYPGQLFFKFRRDPIGFLERIAAEFGNVVHWKIGRENLFFINEPNLIRDVLVTHDKKFGKEMEASRSLLGQGLTASNGALHDRQRRTIQPTFNRERLARFGEIMVRRGDNVQSRWQAGTALDIKSEMERISLAVIGESLFEFDLEPQLAAVSRAMDAVLGSPPNMMIRSIGWIDKLPLPSVRAAKAGRTVMHEIADQIIHKRRDSASQSDDVLGLLLANEQNNNAIMSDEQVHDEVMNLLIGGYETTSDVMTWIWYLLSQNPEVENCLSNELDQVLGDRLPAFTDIEALEFTQNVVRESLRLYPPLWIIWRRALADYPVNEYVAPAGSLFLISQYVMHRDERFFPEPHRFKPERWNQEFRDRLPKFAYFPFGGGSRQCIGDRFGFMEVVLVLATIARKWRLTLEPDQHVVPDPLLTLRPKHRVNMVPLRR